jgi:hypothetical protein
MDSVTAVDASAQDQLTVAISRIAHQYARHGIAPEVADDVAQDVVRECPQQLRSGRWLRAFVRRVAPRRRLASERRSGSSHPSPALGAQGGGS